MVKFYEIKIIIFEIYIGKQIVKNKELFFSSIISKLIFIFLFFGLVIASVAQENANFKRGFYYYNKPDLDSAVYYFEKQINVVKNNDSLLAVSILYLGKTKKIQLKFLEALEHFKTAIKLFQEQENHSALLESYVSLAEFYRAKEQYKSANQYLKLAKDLIDSKEIDKSKKAYYWNRKAAILLENADEVDYKGSLNASKKVIEIAKEIGDKRLEASSLNEIGFFYENQKLYIESSKKYKEALKIYNKINDNLYKADVLVNISRIYHKQGKIIDALPYFQEGYKISKVNNYIISYIIFNELYYLYYKELGDYKKALEYHVARYELKEKFLEERTEKQLIDAEKKYELNRKEKELEINKLSLKAKEGEVKNATTASYISMGLFLVALIVSFLIAYFYRKTQKANKKLTFLSEENKFLMAEANHRINNNLQLIIILINEELKKATKENNTQIKKILTKVDAIATLHKHLYHGSDKKLIRIDKYLKDIQINFFEIFKENNVTTNFEIKPFKIKVDVAMYLGLLLTELSINSLKHAFKGYDDKIIDFNLKTENNVVCFYYKDNGVGSEKEIHLKLVDKLCRQLKIKYQLNTKKGLVFTFKREF